MPRSVQAHRDFQHHYRLRPEARYADYKGDAKRHGRSFRLSLKQFIAYTQMPCIFCERTPEEVVIGVDRRDSRWGYSLKNCAPCCRVCNFAKGKLSENEFMGLIQTIAAKIGRDMYEQFLKHAE